MTSPSSKRELHAELHLPRIPRGGGAAEIGRARGGHDAGGLGQGRVEGEGRGRGICVHESEVDGVEEIEDFGPYLQLDRSPQRHVLVEREIGLEEPGALANGAAGVAAGAARTERHALPPYD